MLEGNGGPGIIIFGASAVSVTSNYFEYAKRRRRTAPFDLWLTVGCCMSRANNAKTPTRWKNLVLKPVLDNSTGENPGRSTAEFTSSFVAIHLQFC